MKIQQEECTDDNHGQRLRVPLAQEDLGSAQCPGILRGQLCRQKGAIENMNKLVRQYIPKGTDFRELTDEFTHSVQLKINRRPREKLNFSTPKDEFFKLLL